MKYRGFIIGPTLKVVSDGKVSLKKRRKSKFGQV
jgi:hypothetical protein